MTDVSANVRITGSDETDAVWKALAAKMQNVTTLAKTCTVEMGQAASASSAAFDSLSGIVAKAAQTTGRSFEAQAAMSQKASVALKGTAQAAKEVGDAGHEHIEGRFSQAMERGGEHVSEFIGKFIGFAAVEETLRRAVENFSEVEGTLLRIQQTTGKTTEEMREMASTLREISRETGEGVAELGSKFQQFSADTGLVGHEAEEVFKTVAKAAEVTGTGVESMSRLAGAALHNLKVKGEEISEVFDAWITELPPKMLAPFAQVAPQLTQSLELMGFTGKKTGIELGAIFETMERATGRPRLVFQELNSMINTLTNIKSPLGAMLLPEISAIQQRGGGMVDVVEKVYETLGKMGAFKGTPIEQAAMARIFGVSPQMLKAIKDVHENVDGIRDSMAKAAQGGGALEKRLLELAKTNEAKLKEMKSAWDEFTNDLGATFSDLGGNALFRNMSTLARDAAAAARVIDGLLKGKSPSEAIKEGTADLPPGNPTAAKPSGSMLFGIGPIWRALRRGSPARTKEEEHKLEEWNKEQEHLNKEHHDEPEPKIFHGDPRRRPGVPAPASPEKHSDAGSGLDGALARSLVVKGVEYGLWGAQMAGKNIPFLGPINAATSAYGGLEGMYDASHSHPPESLADTLRRNQGGQTVRNMGIRGSNVHVLDASNSKPEGVPLHFGDQAPYSGGGLPIDYDKFAEAMKSFPESSNIEDRRNEQDSRTALEKNTDALERIIELLQDGSGGSGAIDSGSARVGAAAGGIGSGGFRRGGSASSGGAAQRFTGGGTEHGSSPSGTGESSGPMGAASDHASHADQQTGDDSGAVPDHVLEKAREVASQGPEAVSQFMKSKGFPKSGPWCGEFAASVVRSQGGTPPKDPQIASNWRRYGTETNNPQPGDVAVRRGPRTGDPGSHVTFFDHMNKDGTFSGTGGNQSGGANTKPFSRSQFQFFHKDGPSGPTAGEARSELGGEGGGGSNAIAKERSRVMAQLNEPGMRELTASVVGHEQGDEAGRADVLESLVNRSVATGKHPRDLIHGGFYGPVNRGELQKQSPGELAAYDRSRAAVAAGRNEIGGRTDQGQRGEVKPEGRANVRGEYYGWMGGKAERNTAAARAGRGEKVDRDEPGKASKTEIPAKWTSPPDHGDAMKEMREMRSEMEKPIKLSARAQSYNTARRQAGRSAQRREQADETRSSRQNALMDIGFA